MSAEAVHRALEDTIPAMEYYYARSVFTKDEIKDIVKTRTAAEYKLHGPGATYNEVVKAVEYEKGLEKLRRVRGKNVPLKNRFDEHIVQRISKLYDRFAIHLEGEDRINLAKHELEFLSGGKSKDQEKKAGQVLGRLVNENPTRDDLWVHAARYEMERKSIGNARALLQQGLRVVPKSGTLWRAYFMIELTYLGELLDALKSDEKAQDEELDPKLRLVLNGAIPQVVHRHCVKAMHQGQAAPQDPALPLTVDFVKICRKFGFTAKLVDALTGYIAEAEGEKTVEEDLLARCGGYFKALDGLVTPTQYLGIVLDAADAVTPDDDDAEASAAKATAAACAAAEGVFAALFDDWAAAKAAGAAADAARAIAAVLLMVEQCVRSAYLLPVPKLLMSAAALTAAYAPATSAPLDEAAPLLAPLLGSGDTARNEHPLYVLAMASVAKLLRDPAVAAHATPAQAIELHHLGVKLNHNAAAGPPLPSPVAALLRAGEAPTAAPLAAAVASWCLAIELSRAAGGSDADIKGLVQAGLKATQGAADQHRLWVAAILAAYRTRLTAKGKAAAGRLTATLLDAISTTAALPSGARRAEALTKVAAVALVADPVVSLAALRKAHSLPESVAAQMIRAAISQHDTAPAAGDGPAIKRRKVAAPPAVGGAGKGVETVRGLFDHLVHGPSGLRKSAQLWALWIRWEERHSTARSLHVRTTATRNPGGIPVGDLDAELAAIPCL
eukprot:TRINITY_DN22679_c0_g1_i1.p1 TRINITY_DN22679_c0_g1~~TRINITY_DN22679_c0_g1_i1.p1  ORF type:complete len:727 (+),score=282.09 TRINITY_DN22679_c0_g1_i1:91-2271(+)